MDVIQQYKDGEVFVDHWLCPPLQLVSNVTCLIQLDKFLNKKCFLKLENSCKW
jgi:hypothetical protein